MTKTLWEPTSDCSDWRVWALKLEQDLWLVYGEKDETGNHVESEPTLEDLPETKAEYEAQMQAAMEEVYGKVLDNKS